MEEFDVKELSARIERIFAEIRKDMIGQEDVIKDSIIAMIAGGNILLEGVPGVGKTRLVRTLGNVFNMSFKRIQFTPDLMPADVTGTNIIVKDEAGSSEFRFEKGPIFANIVLADEINRATPKTQSALLEAMQEHRVTIMGKTYKLEEPFFVLATQNPIEQDGTYPLPEAQMDRFMFKIIVDNPTFSELAKIVALTEVTMDEVSTCVCTKEELLELKNISNKILANKDVFDYAIKLCMATHPTGEYKSKAAVKYVQTGASPRAAQAIIKDSKAKALIEGRYNISIDDINELAYPVLRHRLKLNFEAISDGVNQDDVIGMILKEIK